MLPFVRLALLSSAALLAVPAHAAPEPEAVPDARDARTSAGTGGADEVEEIIVTARHHVESSQAVPLAISVVGGDHIDNTGAFNTQDNLGLRGQLLWRPSDTVNVTLAGDFSTQDPECCAQVYVRTGLTQRGLARQYAALTAAQNYAVPSTNPYDRVPARGFRPIPRLRPIPGSMAMR